MVCSSVCWRAGGASTLQIVPPSEHELEAPIRGLFFAKRGSPAERIINAGADAVILDLEDSVPAAERANTRRWITELLDHGLGLASGSCRELSGRIALQIERVIVRPRS